MFRNSLPKRTARALFLPLVVLLVLGGPWIVPPAYADITAQDIKGYLEGKIKDRVNKGAKDFIKDWIFGDTPSAEMDVILKKAASAIQDKTEGPVCLRAALGLARATGKELARAKILRDFADMFIGMAEDIVGVGKTFTEHLARAGLKLAFDKYEGKVWDEAEKALREAYSKGKPEYYRREWKRGDRRICDIEAVVYWDKADERFTLSIKGNCYCAYLDPKNKYGFPADESAFWEAARLRSGELPKAETRINTFEVLVYTEPGETYVVLGDDGKSLRLHPGEPTVHVQADCLCPVEAGDESGADQSDKSDGGSGGGMPDRWETPLDTAACPKCKQAEAELREAMRKSSDIFNEINDAEGKIGDLEKNIWKASQASANAHKAFEDAQGKLKAHAGREDKAMKETARNYAKAIKNKKDPAKTNYAKPINDWKKKNDALEKERDEAQKKEKEEKKKEKELREEKEGLGKSLPELEAQLEIIREIVKALRRALEECNKTCKDPDDSGPGMIDKSYEDLLRDAIQSRDEIRTRQPKTPSTTVINQGDDIRDRARAKTEQRMRDAEATRPKPKPKTTRMVEPTPPGTPEPTPGGTQVVEPAPTGTQVVEPAPAGSPARPPVETIYEERSGTTETTVYDCSVKPYTGPTRNKQAQQALIDNYNANCR